MLLKRGLLLHQHLQVRVLQISYAITEADGSRISRTSMMLGSVFLFIFSFARLQVCSSIQLFAKLFASHFRRGFRQNDAFMAM